MRSRARACTRPDVSPRTSPEHLTRRSEAADAAGKVTGPRQFTRMFLKLAQGEAIWVLKQQI